jgi:aldose 1-epimerase
MAPWPNRIANGRFTFEDVDHQLPVDRERHALHGLGFERAWDVESISEDACTVSLALGAPWPWQAVVTHVIEVQADGLRLTLEIVGEGPFPAGCGWHPWFRRDVRPGVHPRVLVDADERYELSSDRIPTGRIVAVDGNYDLRADAAMGDLRLDDCYRGLRQPLRIAWGDIELTMLSSANVTHAVIYTPPDAICIEPQTCAIDAFNLDAHGVAAGTTLVDARHPLVATTEWRWHMRG